MDNQVCVRTDYFLLFVVLSLLIISWVIHQVIENYRKMSLSTTDKIEHMYTNITKNERDKRDREEQERRQRDRLDQRDRIAIESIRQRAPPISQIFDNFQLVGYVYTPKHADQMFRLMGRSYNNSCKFEYYVIHPYTEIKIPINVKNDWELNTGDNVDINGFHGKYLVHIYDTDRNGRTRHF